MEMRLSLVPHPNPAQSATAVAPPRESVCVCRCHCSPDAATPSGAAHAGVARTSALEAAVACPDCRDRHCAALSGRPPELEARPWNPPELKPALPEKPCPTFDDGDAPA